VLKAITWNPCFQVISELDVCPETVKAVNPLSGRIDGWFVQQLIKLGISERVHTDFYLTLDSDILCIKPCRYDSLVQFGRALTNLETGRDYDELYTARFSALEQLIKSARYKASANLLGYDRPRTMQGHFYGETPVVLHAPTVRALTDYLSWHLNVRWSEALAQNLKWTEYGLYYQYLEMSDTLHEICRLSGCNSVLDLSRSIWRESGVYRQPRIYDEKHFRGREMDNSCGLFIAIQSWLPVNSWLPEQFRDLSDFYCDVEKWLGLVPETEFQECGRLGRASS